jgi:hypothetical protein
LIDADPTALTPALLSVCRRARGEREKSIFISHLQHNRPQTMEDFP